MENKTKILIGVVVIIAAVGCYWLLQPQPTPDGGDGGLPDNGTNGTTPDNKTNITLIKNADEAIALVKEKYPEVTNISKCEKNHVEVHFSEIFSAFTYVSNLTLYTIHISNNHKPDREYTPHYAPQYSHTLDIQDVILMWYEKGKSISPLIQMYSSVIPFP